MLTCKEYTDLKKKELKKYIEKEKLHPKLVIIQIGDRPESTSYILGKMRDCKEVGIEYVIEKHCDSYPEKTLIDDIIRFNNDESIHGIILQLPVPDHIDVKRIQKLIKPEKDVDGFNKLSPFDPCTPKGVRDFLVYIGYEFEGKDALVIGRSPIVGKPLADMLTDLNCTVTLAHSKTKEVERKMSKADIIFTCIDKIEYWLECWTIHDHTDVIDIGLGAGTDGMLHGNFDHRAVEVMKMRNPERICISGKGGVGLLTRLALVQNVVKAAELCDNANKMSGSQACEM